MSEHDVDTRPMIETHDVKKIYADGKVAALDGVDLSVSAGEFVAITGPSGCGKSTLLSLLAALDGPTSGTIRVGSYELQQLKNADRFRRQEVGLVFQLHNLLPRLSALGNVEIAMMASDRPPAERAKLAHSLDVAGAALHRHIPFERPGGQVAQHRFRHFPHGPHPIL